MDAVILIYNVLLLILYSIVLTLSFLFFRQTKKPLYLFVSVLFLFYIFDNLIIYMTEFVAWFSNFYDNTFMSVPTFKTIIYFVTLLCLIRINDILLKREHSVGFYIGLIVLTVTQLFIPMMQDSALKVWLYYFPCQLFTFFLGLYGLSVLRKNTADYSTFVTGCYRKLLLLTVVFSVLIVLEDTIVIFNFDVYSDIMVKINNRNICEDILSILYSVYIIRVLAQFLSISPDAGVTKKDAPSLALAQDSASPEQPSGSNTSHAENVSAEQVLSKFYLFCRQYQLTTREQDILTLLLENKNNQEISDALMISVGTAKTHTHNIFQKIGVTKRQQLLSCYENYDSSTFQE